MRLLISVFFAFCFSAIVLLSQTEHVQSVHPVYKFLEHEEVKGLIPHGSLTYLPLQRAEVIEYLKLIRKNDKLLSKMEISSLELFEREFEITHRDNTVIFYSSSDSDEILFKGLISNKEKFIYHLRDSNYTVDFLPLANTDFLYRSRNDSTKHVLLGNLGFRLHGTLSKVLGYNLQVTNGTKLSGDRSLAFEEQKLKQNVKFSLLKSDFDFVESHIRFQDDWFYAIIGRETRFVGSGLTQSLYLSDNAPPMDGLSMGARFSNFEYRFDHFSMIAYPDSNSIGDVGAGTKIPPKYMSMHTFRYKPAWGEISYIQTIIYSNRFPELAYLTPLSFSKSLEHSLHDRDKTMMGVFGTARIIDGFQLKGSWMLEDIIFSKIGTGFWSNKTAWNIGGNVALPYAINIGAEYTRIEPYMFTHFNYQNNRTNDGMLIGTYLYPNSDEKAIYMQWYWGQRYPLTVRLAYQRHGDNVYDSTGKMLRNVGGDIMETPYFPRDGSTVVFLDGVRHDYFSLLIRAGFEIIRGFNIQAGYMLKSTSNNVSNVYQFTFSFDDF